MAFLRKTIFALIILTLSLQLFAGGTEELRNASPNAGQNVQAQSISNTLISLNTLYHYIDKNFLYGTDNEKIEESLIEAMLSSLDDPYSEFIKKDLGEEFEENISGLYVGIGTYLSKPSPYNIDWDDETTYMITIETPFPGGPADRAGLRSGDLISHINGEDVYELTASEASKKVRGKEGESEVLTIHRDNAVFDVTVTPEKVARPSVQTEIIRGTEYGYIMISEFTQTTYESLSKELSKLSLENIKGLIIDLRNNGGGMVDSALMICDFFLPKGETLYSVKYKEGSGRQEYTVISTDITRKYTDIPLVILVNGGTASSSEILTAALKENGRATVIGSKTFGKGIMQEIFPWKNGYVKLTTSRYLTPNGNDIHKVGIEPDVEVESKKYTDEETEAFYDFMNENPTICSEYVEEHPEYTKENIEAFSEEHKSDAFPEELLKYRIRNEYIYSIPYDKRPITDLDYDECLLKAISFLDGEK